MAEITPPSDYLSGDMGGSFVTKMLRLTLFTLMFYYLVKLVVFDVCLKNKAAFVMLLLVFVSLIMCRYL